jgi:hypothetical protein
VNENSTLSVNQSVKEKHPSGSLERKENVSQLPIQPMLASFPEGKVSRGPRACGTWEDTPKD